MRLALSLAAVLCATQVFAQDTDHVDGADGIRILHAWTTAGDGPMHVYMEIENQRGADILRTGAQTEDGTIGQLIGAPIKADGLPPRLRI